MEFSPISIKVTTPLVYHGVLGKIQVSILTTALDAVIHVCSKQGFHPNSDHWSDYGVTIEWYWSIQSVTTTRL